MRAPRAPDTAIKQADDAATDDVEPGNAQEVKDMVEDEEVEEDEGEDASHSPKVNPGSKGK